MRVSKSFLILVFLTACLIPGLSQQNLIKVDLSQKGASIPSSMYGVFFEEINHAGDGGLYAEMIRNRGFEDKDVPVTCTVEKDQLVPPHKPCYLTGKTSQWTMPWDTLNKWPGWSLKSYGVSKGFMKLTTDSPLNDATPHSMEIQILRAQPREQVELINEGYWGIAVAKGEKYNLHFYVRAEKGYTGNIIAKIRNEDDVLLCKQEFKIIHNGTWNEYKAILIAKKSDTKATFVLGFTAPGTVWVDYISLFPEKTFRNRKNGLREDVAQKIAGLKPAFVRWPGGCIVEGLTLADRVNWKETLGDPVSRPGVFDLWGYRNSYGFGYQEYLQFCEDIGASAMFVCNAGLSCAYRNGDYCSEDSLRFFVQDALDAIEYAIGDTTTAWGRKRALNGHPAPFPLKYIEVGNENYGALYASRFNAFYKAIKEKYPQITVISTIEYNDEVSLLHKTDMIDPHYYKNPMWFFQHSDMFDKKKPRPDFKVYVGEYACNQGVDSGNMEAALSEAAFMTGMERNSDLVTMCSYAPLIENSNAKNWPVNLIWLNNHAAIGRSSFYVQKMFAENRPDINVSTDLQLSGNDLPKSTFKGLVGLGTSKTKSSFKDFTVMQHGSTIYKADFVNNQNDWEPVSGHWRVEGDGYIQGDLEEHRCSFVRDKTFENCTIEVKARKNKGNEGFSLLFGGIDYKNYYQLHIGLNNGHSLLLEKVEGGFAMPVDTAIPFTVEENRWYDVKVAVNADEVECFIDGRSVLKYTIKEMEKRYAIAGIDTVTNEIVIKVVNAEPVAFRTSIKLEHAGDIEPKGRMITLSAKNKDEENSFKDPTKIYPQTEEYRGFSSDFKMEFKPWSLTVLRVKRK
jgi:alpha-L-arabinofuranosidase